MVDGHHFPPAMVSGIAVCSALQVLACPLASPVAWVEKQWHAISALGCFPLARGLASRKGTGPIGTLLTGLVFASGCMTCFGAAVLIGIVASAGTTGSILLGARLLFLFSLWIGLPLVIAAVAMARILPLLGRLERVAPYMALVSAGINDWAYQRKEIPNPSIRTP